jgi:hypothetical protein
MAALLDEIFRRLLAGSDLDELRLLCRLVFTEVNAQSALAVVNVKHVLTPFAEA